MPSRRVRGAPGGPVGRGTAPRGTGHGLRHHARLLSSGFYRRVYASSASERASSFRIAEQRRRRRGGLMSVRFAAAHGCSSTSRQD